MPVRITWTIDLNLYIVLQNSGILINSGMLFKLLLAGHLLKSVLVYFALCVFVHLWYPVSWWHVVENTSWSFVIFKIVWLVEVNDVPEPSLMKSPCIWKPIPRIKRHWSLRCLWSQTLFCYLSAESFSFAVCLISKCLGEMNPESKAGESLSSQMVSHSTEILEIIMVRFKAFILNNETVPSRNWLSSDCTSDAASIDTCEN